MRKAVTLLALAVALAAPQTLAFAQTPHRRTPRHKPTRRAASTKSNSAAPKNTQATQQPSSQTTGQQSQQAQRPSQTSPQQPSQTQAQQPAQQAVPQVRLDDPVVTPRAGGKSVDELAAEAFLSSLNDALRKPLAGETRLLGTLTRIECAGGGLVFTVEADARTLRLTSDDFKDVQIVAYTPQAGSQLTCGPRKLQSRAVVTYRPAQGAGAKHDGEIVALEFVPENFKLRQ